MQEQLKWWLALTLALLFTYFLQINLFLHPDMMYLLHATKAMLAGGTYTTDFFETNPPLILYLYTPALFLTKLSGLSILISFRIYILALCFLSLTLCKTMSDGLILDKKSRYVLLAALAVSILILPVHNFGQRDHVMTLLVFPYCFAAMLRLEDKSLSFNLGLLIGVFAALGIGLKPFFLSIPLLIESYLFYKKRSLLRLIRIETLALVSTLLFYIIFAILRFPDYFQVILPLVSRLYFPGTSLPWSIYFNNIYIEFVLLSIMAFGLMRLLKLPNQHATINNIIFITLCAFTLAFSIPHTLFYYQILPAFGTAYLLLIFLLYQLPARNSIAAFGLVMLNFAVVILPLYVISNTYKAMYESQNDIYLKRLVEIFNSKQPDKRYLYLSSSVDSMLFNYYADGIYVGHYPSFWWELGMRRSLPNEQTHRDQTYLVNLITQNLVHEKPHYVLMDTVIKATHEVRKIDYVQQFASDEAFQKVWNNYHYLTTIGRFKIYEYNA